MKQLGAANILGVGYMYKTTLCLLLMGLPLFVGTNLRLTHGEGTGVTLTDSSSANSAAEQPSGLAAPMIIAARDEQTEQCYWLGTCPEPESGDIGAS